MRAVLQAVREGKSDEMTQSIKLPKYEQWSGYKESFRYIEDMYRMVQANLSRPFV